jgi:hypothetical protein
MKKLLIFCFIITGLSKLYSQVIFTESFTIILDSSRVGGSITPEIRIRTQKKVLTQIDNLADVSIRVKNSRLTFANRIEFSQYGNELALSGGYLYAELRNFTDKMIVPEYYGQVVYDHPRGLQIKYAGGINARLRIYTKNNLGLFFGFGPFYEYETWNYNGVKDELVPIDASTQTTQQIKLASYISYKQILIEIFNIDISAYYHDKFTEMLTFPRLASSIKIGIQLTEHFEALIMYQNVYDFKPVVPKAGSEISSKTGKDLLFAA